MEKFVAITDRFTVDWESRDQPHKSDTVRLRTVLSGISAGTEGMWYDGSAPALVSGRRGYPYTPGYELVGTVETIGEDVAANPDRFPRLASLKPGDRVFAFKPHASIADITENDMWTALPDHVASEDALGLALSCTCIHAMHRTGHGLGEHGAVVGLGVVGMIMIQMLQAAGAGRIVASTRSPDKEKLARAFGATNIVDVTSASAGDLPLCETVYECSGTSDGIFHATKLAANQGRLAGVGFYTQDIRLSGEDIFAKELTVYGVRASGAAGNRSEFVRWPRTENLKLAASYLDQGKVSVASLVSHRFKPDDIEKAYRLIHEHAEPYLLVILDWQATTAR